MNIQSSWIWSVVWSFVSAAIPVNIIASFRNEGISVIRHDDDERVGWKRRILFNATGHSARCLMGHDAVLAIPDI
jgi:hypothetical protein